MRQDDADGVWRVPGADVEFEVSRLDASPDTTHETSPVGSSYGSTIAGPSGEMVLEGEAVPVSSRMTPRRRAMAVVLAVAAAALALVLVLGAPDQGVPLLQALFATRTPTAPLAPGDDQVILENSVPWGVLRLDGRQIDMPTADPSLGIPYPILQLSRGSHTIDYSAGPFPPRHCVVSVPAAVSDTCGGRANMVIQGFPAHSVDLRATPTNLPPDQYAALTAAVDAALTFPAGELAPGDHYARQNGDVAAATQALQARLLASLNSEQNGIGGAIINGQDCSALCSLVGPGEPTAAGPAAWALMANVEASWQFIDGAGHVVDTAPVVGGDAASLSPPLLVGVSISWNGSWSATLPAPQPEFGFDGLCGAGVDLLRLMVGSVASNDVGLGFNSTQGHSFLDGCLLTAQQSPGEPTGPSTPAETLHLGSVLYRYGALIAADSDAHQTWRQLPLPSPRERAIIAAFESTQPGPVVGIPKA